jgi:hypothetical protein
MKPMMETHINAHKAARAIAKKRVEQQLREQGEGEGEVRR